MASTANLNGRSNARRDSTGALTSVAFNFSNAISQLSVHAKGTILFRRVVNGSVMSEKFGQNFQ